MAPAGSQGLSENGLLPVGKAREETPTVNLRSNRETVFVPKVEDVAMCTALKLRFLFAISGRVFVRGTFSVPSS